MPLQPSRTRLRMRTRRLKITIARTTIAARMAMTIQEVLIKWAPAAVHRAGRHAKPKAEPRYNEGAAMHKAAHRLCAAFWALVVRLWPFPVPRFWSKDRPARRATLGR